MTSTSGQVKISEKWEVIGPFPSGMREHPLLSSPLAAFADPSKDPDKDFAYRPYDEADSWPSELGIDGRVGWKKFQVGEDGWLEVSYPEIRWDQLRSDHGWAALQHQCILRTTLTISAVPGQRSSPVLIDAIQGTEFALVPLYPSTSDDSALADPLRWYAGDIYDFASTPSGTKGQPTQTSNLARSLSLQPGEYVLLTKAMYEIRMFGDPAPASPTIRIKIQAEIESPVPTLLQGLAEMPDALDGWFMGDWLSIPVRVPAGHDEVTVVGVEGSFGHLLDLILPRDSKIASGQIRPIPVRLSQSGPLPTCIRSLDIRLTLKIGEKTERLTWRPQFQHQLSSPAGEDVDHSELKPFRITFASPHPVTPGCPAQISHAVIVPPRSRSTDGGSSNLPPVLLALHGAGVDASLPFWVDAMPDVPGVWAVLPTGHNEWGEDWHGGSMEDVWAAREAFGALVSKVGVEASDRTLLLGHSNGGQGVWHAAARYPDRIAGVIAASGYLTIQHYVPYTELTSTHYADPALMGILSASLTPYDNDLYLSNLVNIPILVIHGADDTNVPPRHSRAYVNLISSWAGDQSSPDVRLIEVPKKDHWWEGGLQSPEVLDFISSLPSRSSWDDQRRTGFTLTTANPQESGGRAGIRIAELDVPGRLARLDVNARQWRDSHPAFPLDLRGTNIKRIEVSLTPSPNGAKRVMSRDKSEWKEEPGSFGPLTPPRAYGPMIRLLATSGPMTIIVPSSSVVPSTAWSTDTHLSIAGRIAHDIYLYHRIGSEIISDHEGLLRVAREELGDGNVVVIGRPEDNLYANWMISQKRTPLSFPTKGVMLLDDRVIYDRGAGLITLHPHPTSPKALAALIAGNDNLGLELAARLFPIRTGVPIPDWAIVSPRTRWRGAGGLIGAGFWDGEWGWNEAMSWVDR